ncbi:hypothetical protein H5410_050702 [Solanum commersonii]|uniref:Uncharacterized protein n=1 Tax=Solanum commersonii TaxID=4109 RepID=A0A9J5WW87_SOLCO|nr:hypothetical protein H5410_050702 [Solanum commersonii]
MASASHTNDDEKSCMIGEAQSANSYPYSPGRFLKGSQISPLDYLLAMRALGRTQIVEAFINISRINYTCKGTLSKTGRSISKDSKY